jgi:hypothetical protein
MKQTLFALAAFAALTVSAHAGNAQEDQMKGICEWEQNGHKSVFPTPALPKAMDGPHIQIWTSRHPHAGLMLEQLVSFRLTWAYYNRKA